MDPTDALVAAIVIVRDQANELAHYVEFTPEGKALPEVVKKAIRTEIARLRSIADSLQGPGGTANE